MTPYFDSSAFVKLVVREPGSDDALVIFADAPLVASSCVLEVEARAGVERARRAGRIRGAAIAAVRREVGRLLRAVDSVWLDEDVVHRAGDLAEGLGLRGYDAVHLASFERLLPDAVLVTADRELADAARSLGYAVAAVDS